MTKPTKESCVSMAKLLRQLADKLEDETFLSELEDIAPNAFGVLLSKLDAMFSCGYQPRQKELTEARVAYETYVAVLKDLHGGHKGGQAANV